MLYAHIAKGWTVGHTFSRLLLRSLISIPGIAIDLIVAIFWMPDYRSYWNNGISYSDGTRVGVMQGVFGWLGEILGYIVGSIIGPAIGFAIFFPNGILMLAALAQRGIYSALDDLTMFIGRRPDFFHDYSISENPADYTEKAWNVGSAILGTLIAVVPFSIAKVLEFMLPFMGNELSRLIIQISSWIGGVLGGAMAIPLYPVKYLVAKVFDLVDLIRDKILGGIAILYAKNNQSLANNQDCCCPDAIHSPEFQQRVAQAQRSTWTGLMFGRMQHGEPAEVRPIVVERVRARPVSVIRQPAEPPVSESALENYEKAGAEIDSITHDLLGYDSEGRPIPIGSLPCGHSYNVYADGKSGIFGTRENGTLACPYDRARYPQEALVHNIAADQQARTIFQLSQHSNE